MNYNLIKQVKLATGNEEGSKSLILITKFNKKTGDASGERVIKGVNDKITLMPFLDQPIPAQA